MENNRISIRNGARTVTHGDRRCKRPNGDFPDPTVRFDVDGRRLVAVWSWTGVEVAGDGNRLKINVMPMVLLVPVSYN